MMSMMVEIILRDTTQTAIALICRFFQSASDRDHGGGCLNCDLVLVDVELPCLGLWPHALAVEHVVEQLARHLVVIIMMVMTMMIVITIMLLRQANKLFTSGFRKSCWRTLWVG